MSYLVHCFEVSLSEGWPQKVGREEGGVFDPSPGIDQNSVPAHENVHVCGGALWQSVRGVHANGT